MSTTMADISARISVLTIGDELLSGEVVDTNMQSIAKSLREVGFVIFRHLTVGDDIDEIVGAVRVLSAESDILLVTGGLGPTNDDITTEAVAKAVKRPLEFQGHLAANLHIFFESMGRPMPDENLVDYLSNESFYWLAQDNIGQIDNRRLVTGLYYQIIDGFQPFQPVFIDIIVTQ